MFGHFLFSFIFFSFFFQEDTTTTGWRTWIQRQERCSMPMKPLDILHGRNTRSECNAQVFIKTNGGILTISEHCICKKLNNTYNDEKNKEEAEEEDAKYGKQTNKYI